jgi:hypothetical protein
MHSLFRRRRPWLWLAAAGLLMLYVVGVVWFFTEGPDGSEEALERVELGMNRVEAFATLARTPYESKWGGSYYLNLAHVSKSGPAGHPSPKDPFVGMHHVTTYSFRDHDIDFQFDDTGFLVAKHRLEKKGKPRWWHRPLAYWNRIRAALGF